VNRRITTGSTVPILDMDAEWTDEKLYKCYGVTQEEVAFIEKMIRPMDTDTEPSDE